MLLMGPTKAGEDVAVAPPALHFLFKLYAEVQQPARVPTVNTVVLARPSAKLIDIAWSKFVHAFVSRHLLALSEANF